MWAHLLVVFILPLLSASSFDINQDPFQDQLVTYLRPDEPHVQAGQSVLQSLYIHNKVHVFCKVATPKTMWNVFQSSRLLLQMPAGGDYKQYKAQTAKEVNQAHRQLKENFEGKPMGLGTREHRIIPLSAHSDNCYGIYTDSQFVLALEVSSCDWERVAQFTFGVVLWISCPLLADSLLWAYCSAAALGAHLAGVVVVFGAVLASGGERSLARLCPLKGNFKQVFEERPTLVTLTLVIGAWIVQAGCRKCYVLWQYPIIRNVHCRLLRTVSYCLILTASDYRGFGRVCLCLLFPWPEVWWLLLYLRSVLVLPSFLKRLFGGKYIKAKAPKARQKPSPVDPDSILRSRFPEPQHMPRLPSEGNLMQVRRSAAWDPFSVNENSSFNNLHMRNHQEQLDRQGREDEAYPLTETAAGLNSTWNEMPQGSSTPYSKTNLSCIYRNPNFRDKDYV